VIRIGIWEKWIKTQMRKQYWRVRDKTGENYIV